MLHRSHIHYELLDIVINNKHCLSVQFILMDKPDYNIFDYIVRTYITIYINKLIIFAYLTKIHNIPLHRQI